MIWLLAVGKSDRGEQQLFAHIVLNHEYIAHWRMGVGLNLQQE